MNEEEREALGRWLAEHIESDQKLLDCLAKHAAIESSRESAKEVKGEISEDPFNKLHWEDGKNLKGPYQAARLPQNNNSGFQQCQNILRQNIGEKAHTFSEKSWKYYYWVTSEGNTVFRRIKKKS